MYGDYSKSHPVDLQGNLRGIHSIYTNQQKNVSSGHFRTKVLFLNDFFHQTYIYIEDEVLKKNQLGECISGVVYSVHHRVIYSQLHPWC
jgi:hypothetical protein